MSFEIWLFTIKHLAQSYDMALTIFDQLSKEQQEELRKEYEVYTGGQQWKTLYLQEKQLLFGEYLKEGYRFFVKKAGSPGQRLLEIYGLFQKMQTNRKTQGEKLSEIH